VPQRTQADVERRVTVPRPASIVVTVGPPQRVEPARSGYRDDAHPVEQPSSLTLTRRWAHGPVLGRGVFFVVSTALVGGGVVWLADDRFFTFFLGTICALALLPALYSVLAEVLNRTEIVIADGQLRVTNGPLPVSGAGRVTLDAASITQIFVRRRVWGRQDAYVGYTLWARAAGRDVELIGRTVPLQDARYLEQTIEAHLGIDDDRTIGDV